MQGRFLVIDGTDGSGKATQAKRLITKLRDRNYCVETVDFPQYGNKSAALVEEYLNGRFGNAEAVTPYQASIFYACDRFAASVDMKRWLSEGKMVIANRYVSSNMGHQAGKIKDSAERKRFLDWLENLEYGIFNIPRPDMTFFLYVPVEIGQKLVEKKTLRKYIEGGRKKDIHEADVQHLKDAEQTYIDITKAFDNWKRIDCVKGGNLMSIEDIHSLVWKETKRLL